MRKTTFHFANSPIAYIGNIEVYKSNKGYILFDRYNNKIMCI